MSTSKVSVVHDEAPQVSPSSESLAAIRRSGRLEIKIEAVSMAVIRRTPLAEERFVSETAEEELE